MSTVRAEGVQSTLEIGETFAGQVRESGQGFLVEDEQTFQSTERTGEMEIIGMIVGEEGGAFQERIIDGSVGASEETETVERG